MALALAVPVSELLLALVSAGALAVATCIVVDTADKVATNLDLPAKIRAWVSQHAKQFEQDCQKREEREPTPVTFPK